MTIWVCRKAQQLQLDDVVRNSAGKRWQVVAVNAGGDIVLHDLDTGETQYHNRARRPDDNFMVEKTLP